MKIDTYTKVLLTGIFLFLGVIAFDLKPDIEAQAGIMGGNEMIASFNDKSPRVWHLKDGKVRHCIYFVRGERTKCTAWNN